MSSIFSPLYPSPPARRLAAAAVCLGTITVPFDSAVNVAFPDIVRSFGLAIPDIQWIVIAYTLTYAALMLVFGRAGDMIGHRRIFLLGTAVSGLAFPACALAASYEWLLAARVLQGVGAALTLSCGPALLTSLYPEAERARVLGIYTLVFGIGGACGPILAGIFVARWGWPAVFFFRAPIALLALSLALTMPKGDRKETGQAFDITGALLLVAMIATLLLALNGLQQIDDLAFNVTLFAIAGLIAVGFAVQELRTADPIINLRFFKDGDFALLNIAHTLLNLSSFAILLLVPFYLARIDWLTTPVAGALLAASPLGVAIAAPVAGRLPAASPRQLALLGAAAVCAAQLTIGLFASTQNLAVIAAASLLQGAGAGLFQVAYFDIATGTLPRENRGVAGSLVMMTRTVGLVTGATLLMLVFQRLSMPGSPQQPAGAFLFAFSATFFVAAAISFAVVAAALLRGWGKKPKLNIS